ncbi:hypothetical protein K449DRAFT_429475 [Hypoxylon sp. EC38]|nr:hypothetical protein K449DRAFT_429475 [Hypoxylon sp. EC38]
MAQLCGCAQALVVVQLYLEFISLPWTYQTQVRARVPNPICPNQDLESRSRVWSMRSLAASRPEAVVPQPTTRGASPVLARHHSPNPIIPRSDLRRSDKAEVGMIFHYHITTFCAHLQRLCSRVLAVGILTRTHTPLTSAAVANLTGQLQGSLRLAAMEDYVIGLVHREWDKSDVAKPVIHLPGHPSHRKMVCAT